MKIVFFGTPEFAATSLEEIVKSGIEVSLVVTSVDKPAGRGQKIQQSAVKMKALELGLPIAQPKNLKDETFVNEIRELGVDLGVVIAFRMLPEVIWAAPPLGTINLHASLLPDYRGAAPIQHAIIQGESKTGVTTFFLKHEIDTGDIIKSEVVGITDTDTGGSLQDKLMYTGAKLMVESLNEIEKFREHTPTINQNKVESTKIAPKINREFCKIDLNEPAKNIHNKIRGLSPYPGAWIESKWGDVKLLESQILEEQSSDSESGLCIVDKRVLLGTTDNFLEITKLQPAGRGKISSIDFINGQKNI